MQSYYVVQANSFGSPQYATDENRATALECTIILGDPSGQVTTIPSVLVMSSVLAPVIFPDDTGQATLSEVQSAMSTASSAEATEATKLASAKTTVPVLVQQVPGFQSALATDISSVTNGWGTLTAAEQQAIVLRMLNGFDTIISGLEAIVALVTAGPGA